VSQICLDRRDDDARLDRNEIDPDECNAYPRIDDNAFVKNAVEDVDQIPAAILRVNQHGISHAPRRQAHRSRRPLFGNASVGRAERQVFERSSNGIASNFRVQQYCCHQLFLAGRRPT